MLSESMLQKFTNKIQNLVSNQQSERSQSQSQVEVINSDDDVAVPNNRSSSSENNKKKQRANQVVSNGQEEFKKFHYEPNDDNAAINTDGNDGSSKPASKINIKELSKSIVQQSIQERQSASLSTIRKTVAPVPAPAKKTTAQNLKSPINGPPQTARGVGLIEMPKVAVMNNLIKLSTKLSLQEFLQQVKYQATLISISPIRLLLYFCVEKILYFIYEINGLQKMASRSNDFAFLMEQVNMAFVYLLDYVKTTERPLISRVLKSVLNRLRIPQTNQQRWFADFIKNYRKALIAAGISIEQLEKPLTNLNITSNIFLGVLTPDRKIKYSYPALELEDQERATQKILDPEIYHEEQTLFYFGKALNKVKQKAQKATRSGSTKKPDDQKDDSTKSDNHLHEKKFCIQISKDQIPFNTKLYSNSKNLNEFQIVNAVKVKPVQISDSQIAPVKRSRAIVKRTILEESKQSEQVQKTAPSITKQQIIKIVQQSIRSSIPEISKKLVEKWKFDPSKLKQMIKQTIQQSGLARQMPSKSKPNSQPVAQTPTISVTRLKQKQKPKQKIQSQSQILREIDTRSTQLQTAGVSHKQLVKQIFKILESKNLSHEKKEQVMEKWIAIKKARKNR